MSFARYLAVAVALLHAAGCASAPALRAPEAVEHRRQVAVSPELQSLSDRVRELQGGLRARFGLDKVYIVGGGARAILDHLYRGKALAMRDLDVFVPAGRVVEESFAEEVGRTLASKTLGRFAREHLRPRPRSNPALPPPARLDYNAGYGFFFVRDALELDLTLFNSEEDFALNGIVDADCIRIPLVHGTTLASWAAGAGERSYERLLADGGVVDPYGGYAAWLKREMRIVHWTEVEREPMMAAIRIVRLFAKAGQAPSEGDAKRLRALLASSERSGPVQSSRNLLKLLGDPDPVPQLKTLASLGAFGALFPGLDRAMSRPDEELRSLLRQASPVAGGRAPPVALGRLKALAGLLPPAEQGKVFQTLAAYEPIAGVWALESGEGMERVVIETSDAVGLVGDYYPGPERAVLLVHMMPATKESWADFALDLSSAGFAVLAIDLRGHGESLRGPGERLLDFRKFSDEEHQSSIRDLEAGVEYLRRRGASEVFLAGASIGANLALWYLSEHPEIRKAALLSAGTDYRGIRGDRLAEKLAGDQALFLAAGTKDERKAGSAADMARAISKLTKGPVGLRTPETEAHGTDLLRESPALREELVNWLRRRD